MKEGMVGGGGDDKEHKGRVARDGDDEEGGERRSRLVLTDK